MDVYPDIASIAALIAAPARAAMLTVLMDGSMRPAGELAFCADLSAQAASSHLTKLLESRLIAVTTAGRHRYYRLASAEIAQLLECVMTLTGPLKLRDRPSGRVEQQIRLARTCYDHLAGRLGVAVTESLVKRKFISQADRDFTLTPPGIDWFAGVGINLSDLTKHRRHFARACLDWSERQFHLGGALGAALAARLFDLKWTARVSGSRAVRLTEKGRSELMDQLGLRLE